MDCFACGSQWRNDTWLRIVLARNDEANPRNNGIAVTVPPSVYGLLFQRNVGREAEALRIVVHIQFGIGLRGQHAFEKA